MATHTPIPYWLSLTVGDVYAWNATVVQIQTDDSKVPT